MKRPIVVLLNRGGGTVAANPHIRKDVASALTVAGLGVKIELIDGGKCEMRCRSIAKRGDGLVIVGGGDGTISAAASALVGTETLLGILPLGTLNHFARDLGIPSELEDAARMIAERPERRVDVAEMNGRIFINNSAIGLYPLMVVDRDSQQKKLGRSKRVAMIVASIRTLLRFNHQRLTLTVNDEKAGRIDTPLLFVGNNNYRLDIAAAGERASLDDGQLFVLVMRKKTRSGLIAASVRALVNRNSKNDLVQLENVERLRVASRKHSLAVSLDGEVVRAEPPLDYKIHRKALRVVAPRK